MASLIPLFVALALAGAFLCSLLGRRWTGLCNGIAGLTTLSLLALSLAGLGFVRAGGALTYAVGGWAPPLGIPLILDGLSAFMLLTVNLVAFLVFVYSVDYMRRFTGLSRFHSLSLLMLAGMNGVIITGDLFNLFVFLELASVASYALVAFGTERHELEAAFKYAVVGTVGSLCILTGIVWLYSLTSTLNMADMAQVLDGHRTGYLVLFTGALFVMGFGLKAALVPFHAWLPDAHPAAPAPISAMLSGVLIKSLGVYALCRVFYGVLGVTPQLSQILVLLGVVSMLAGVVLALGQWDIKRLLAYHSISQVGYIVLGIGLGTPLGLVGGLFHLFNHSVFKSLLFLNSGSIEQATGTRDLRRMGGLGRRMPVTGSTTLVASLSIAGMPPFNGFWSKLLIILAAVEAGRYGLAAFAVVASLLTLASFAKVMKFAFMGDQSERWNSVREAPAMMRVSMILMALICLFGGSMLLPAIGDLTLYAASDVLAGFAGTAGIVFPGDLP